MSDAELEQIRAARLAQLQQRQSSQSGPSGGGLTGGTSGGGDDDEDRQASARANILSQILLPAAIDRINRIRLVKASRATDVENRLISLAQSGQLRERVTEEQLKELLGAISENERGAGGGSGGGEGGVAGAGGGVEYRGRRKGGWDEDDDEDLEDLLRS